MIYRDKLEQEIINGIIELDQKNAVIAIDNLISINFFKTGEELLRHGHYISIDRVEKKCLFKVASYSQLERKELEEYFEYVCKTLLLIFVLLENLRDERYVLVIGDSTPSAIGSAFDDKFEKHRFTILYRELEEKILALSGKEFIPTKKLIDYVKNGFKSLDELALEKQLQHQDAILEKQGESINQQNELIRQQKAMLEKQGESNKTARLALLVAMGGVIASSLIPLITTNEVKIEEPVKIKNENVINAKIVNDSLKVSIKSDTAKIVISNPITIKNPVDSNQPKKK